MDCSSYFMRDGILPDAPMTLIINNDDVAKVLTMDDDPGGAGGVLPRSSRRGEAMCRPRIDIRIPTSRSGARTTSGARWKAARPRGYFAIRMKSDVVYESEYGGVAHAGEILLAARPVLRADPAHLDRERRAAGLHQRRRAAAHARGRRRRRSACKYMANATPKWSACWAPAAWRARTCEAFTARAQHQQAAGLQPDRENREAFGARDGARTASRWRSATRRRTSTRRAYRRRADRFRRPGDWTAPARAGHAHRQIGGGGIPDAASLARVDVYLRFGNSPAPVGTARIRARRREPRLGGAPGAGATRRRPHKRAPTASAAGQGGLPRGHASAAGEGPHLGATRSPIRSAATCRARSSTPSPAGSTSGARARAWGARFRPNGSCRTSATDDLGRERNARRPAPPPWPGAPPSTSR